MQTGSVEVPALDLSLRRDASGCELELRFTSPGNAAEHRAASSAGPFDPQKLRRHEQDATETGEYGRALSAALFSDAVARNAFSAAVTLATQAGLPLRIRLFIDPDAPDLHHLRWETLTDPATGQALFSGDRFWFSRFLTSDDWRAVTVEPRNEVSALVVVSNPVDLGQADIPLAAVDVEAERARAREELDGIAIRELPSGGTASLTRIVSELRDSRHDVLYLVCHGALLDPKGDGDPTLWLETATGESAPTDARDLVRELAKLSVLPRLVVLASCQSAGTGKTAGAAGALMALGPMLATAGVPAVVAMQGNVRMDTIAAFMPVFFRELRREGIVDRAMAIARGTIGASDDFWSPVLFMRLRDGRLWSTPTEIHRAATPPAASRPALRQLRPAVDDFCGRLPERNVVVDALAPDGTAALALIQGLAGTGKTELARSAASIAATHYPDAQLWIDLRGTTKRPRSVAEALTLALRSFRGRDAGLPDEVEALTEEWRAEVDGKRVLVVLDDAVTADQLKVFAPLPGSALLATSRESLMLPGMRRVMVEELPVDEARQLFLGAVAMMREPVAEAVADEICGLCGCLPLAVRAAANFVGMNVDLDPAAFAAQLRDERDRLKAIGAEGIDVSIEASLRLTYDKLGAEAARVFRCLSVFAGSFDAAAEEAVALDERHRTLGELVRRGLVSFDSRSSRYRLQELVRVFARSCLDDHERAGAVERHIRHFAGLLTELASRPVADPQTLKILDTEWNNVRAAKARLDADPSAPEDLKAAFNLGLAAAAAAGRTLTHG